MTTTLKNNYSLKTLAGLPVRFIAGFSTDEVYKKAKADGVLLFCGGGKFSCPPAPGTRVVSGVWGKRHVGTVTGYFYEAGFVGVNFLPDVRPECWKKQGYKGKCAHLMGTEIALEQDEHATSAIVPDENAVKGPAKAEPGLSEVGYNSPAGQEVLKRACPSCGSLAGQVCTSLRQNGLDNVHAARLTTPAVPVRPVDEALAGLPNLVNQPKDPYRLLSVITREGHRFNLRRTFTSLQALVSFAAVLCGEGGVYCYCDWEDPDDSNPTTVDVTAEDLKSDYIRR
ncbi:MAG: hypothetical protein WC729_29635 [Sphingomonas sp.]|jgi:hypothetical protein|uniref:hypothetical protein n=1 Tax=Sphingomonas sp. TaxID=28214 RepID=UPI003563D6CC